MVVDLPDQFDCRIEFALSDVSGTGQDDRAGILDLVFVEFFEVLQIDLALAGVDDGHGAADLGAFHFLHSGNDIGEFADAGGLDEDTVRSILIDDFFKSGAEIADEGAADAARVHLGDLDAGLL